MQAVYIVYALLGAVGMTLNLVTLVLRRRSRGTSSLRGISAEHSVCLAISNLSLTAVSIAGLVASFQDLFRWSSALCDAAGYITVCVVLTHSWMYMPSAVVLLEKEYHKIRLRSYQGLTTRIIWFISAAILVTCAVLVSICYIPITEFQFQRQLLCLPVAFSSQPGYEYTLLLLALVWCGVLSTWLCVLAWFITYRKNRGTVRYVTEHHRSSASACVEVAISFSLWTVVVSLLSVYFWRQLEDLLHAAIFLSLLHAAGHPGYSLLSHWFTRSHDEVSAVLNRDTPTTLSELSLMTVNPDKSVLKFHGKWLGRFGEKIEAVIKVYNQDQRTRWMREIRAMLILKKTEHPNIVKYLWVGQGGSFTFPIHGLSQESAELLMKPSQRMVCVEYYKHGSLKDLLLHTPRLLTGSTLRHIALDVTSALAHLRQLHIVHNKLCSRTIFIKSISKNGTVGVVVGSFEESEQITLDHVRSSGDPSTQDQWGATIQLDQKFAADIRSYALFIFELVAAWNKHNGQQIKAPTHTEAAAAVSVMNEMNSHSLQDYPLGGKKKVRRNKPPVKSRSLLHKPEFSEIVEEHQSHLHLQRLVDGEEMAIEMEYGCPSHQQEASVLPVGVVADQLFTYNKARYHPVFSRTGSSSACSTDSGYPKSLLSNAVSNVSDLHSQTTTADYAGAPCYLTNENPRHEVPRKPSPDIYIISQERSHHPLSKNDIQLGKLPVNELTNYMRAKQTLPRDILEDCEEYRLDDSLPSEDDQIYETIEMENQESKIGNTPSGLNLVELAEKVTEDVNQFLKSRTNSSCSSPASSTIKTVTPTSESPSHVTSCKGCIQTRQLSKLTVDRTVYKNSISDMQKENISSTFLARPGVRRAQIYYSRELSSTYDIITSRVLHVNSRITRKYVNQYIASIDEPAIKQLLMLTEQCWLQDPVPSADSIMSQLRNNFTLTS